jgi:hypothetical protein
MAYANVDDIEAILPPENDMPVDPSREYTNLITALEESTDLVIGYIEREYTANRYEGVPSDVPDAVRRVTARVAMRAFTESPDNPGAEAETNLMGPFSHTINWSKEAQARDFYLTASDKMRLDRFKTGYVSGAVHIAMWNNA